MGIRDKLRQKASETIAEPITRIMALCVTAIVLSIVALLAAVTRGR